MWIALDLGVTHVENATRNSRIAMLDGFSQDEALANLTLQPLNVELQTKF